MSKMSKLDSILKEAEEHAQALVSCINEIRELYSGANEVAPKKANTRTRRKAAYAGRSTRVSCRPCEKRAYTGNQGNATPPRVQENL